MVDPDLGDTVTADSTGRSRVRTHGRSACRWSSRGESHRRLQRPLVLGLEVRQPFALLALALVRSRTFSCTCGPLRAGAPAPLPQPSPTSSACRARTRARAASVRRVRPGHCAGRTTSGGRRPAVRRAPEREDLTVRRVAALEDPTLGVAARRQVSVGRLEGLEGFHLLDALKSELGTGLVHHVPPICVEAVEQLAHRLARGRVEQQLKGNIALLAVERAVDVGRRSRQRPSARGPGRGF